MRCSIALIVLTGCGTGLSQFGDTSATSAVQIERLDPAWGPTAGGTGITLTGVGFEGSVTVAFDGIPIDAFVQDTSTLLLTTPGWSLEDVVDVTVTTDLGADTLVDGYAYSNDGPPDTGTPGGGAVIGLGEFGLVQYACPACMGLSTDLTVDASVAFHTAIPGSWIDWMPAIGSCAVNPTNPGPTTTYQDTGQWVYLQSGSTSVPLVKTSGDRGPYYVSTGLDNEDYTRNASYTVDASSGGGPVIPNGLLTTEGFDSITPFELLYVNVSAAFQPVVRKSGTTFTWAPANSGNRFLILVDAYSSNGQTYLGNSICVGSDTGALSYPGGALPWSAGSLLTVGLYRYRTNRTPIPGEDGDFESVSYVGVVGTATLRN